MQNEKIKMYFLCTSFPYYPGEEFIENEIDYLSNVFELIIIPFTMGNGVLREINSNIKIDLSLANQLQKIPNIIKYLYAFFSFVWIKNSRFKIKDIIIQVKEVLGEGFKGLYIKNYFERTYKNDLEKGSILYSYWMLPHGIALSLLKQKYYNNVYFSRAHGFDLYSKRRSFNYIPYQKYLLKSLDYVFPCSEDGSDFLIEMYPEFNNKIKRKYLGVPLQIIEDSYNFSENSFRIISVSSVIELKRVDLICISLIELSKSLKKKIEWTHIGNGNKLEEIREILNKNANVKNINVQLLGQMTNKKVIEYYKNNCKNIDCFINLSKHEGLPVSVMEAMSFKIPLVLCDTGSMREQVINGYNGFLISHNPCIDEICEALKKIAELEYIEMVELRKNTQNLFIRKFNAKNNYIDFIETIKSIYVQRIITE